MPKKLSPLTLAIIASSLPSILIAEEQTDQGYPAPPGIYGQPEILKNSQFNMGTGSPYIVIEKQGETPSQTNTVIPDDSHPAIQQSHITQTTADSELPPPKPEHPEPVSTAARQTLFESAQSSVAQPWVENTSYPDAARIRQQYLDAGQLPFDQWGAMPQTGSGDYGSAAVPIDTSRPSYLSDRPFNAPSNKPARKSSAKSSNSLPYNYYPKSMPYDFFSERMSMPSWKNAYPGNFNAGDFMDGFVGNRERYDRMPAPSATYLKPFDQLPVPQMAPADMYGPRTQPFATPGTNVQYMPRIPEEDIIYPPNYPGNR